MINKTTVWMHYQARSFGLDYAEYIAMTPGEIEDMAMCRAISNGAYKEIPVPSDDDSIFPDLR